MSDKKFKIGITHGDTNGIGYEVILKALEDNRLLELCTPVVYGSAKAAAFYRKTMDFVMNHTSEDHDWARRARAGEPGYRERYFFYDSWEIPRAFERTVPQVFPTTAPGSFTQLEGGQIVMTSFYPYQWDLNYANPVVFNDMTENMQIGRAHV